ncbi:putative RNA methyltransferase [Pseudobowmanella zhangzhouensis]|uniref:putative RNA methyltransferase n=1 Tax=Pseudobowmanella zhangzhouensis TaxID=1537679 RepID=UPI00361C3095
MTDSLYQCPVCQLPLTLAERTYRCDNGHSFDQHKKGYVNLLLVQNKRSKMPGDDADMVQSRRGSSIVVFISPWPWHSRSFVSNNCLPMRGYGTLAVARGITPILLPVITRDLQCRGWIFPSGDSGGQPI